MQHPLHIATAIDSSYLLPLRVMAASLTGSLAPAFRPVLHLLHRDLTDAQLVGLQQIIEVRPVAITAGDLSNIPRHRRFPREAAAPLLLAGLLQKDVKKVLFLDPDVLVLDDLGTLWNLPLSEHVLAAAADPAVPTCGSPRGVKDTKSIGVPNVAPYFNAGVMLIDLERWRETRVTPRALEYLEKFDGSTDFYHQEALNAVLWKQWLQLEPRWNVIASTAGRTSAPSVTSPAIVHFSGYFKPWKLRLKSRYARDYERFLAHHAPQVRQDKSLRGRLLSFYDLYVRDYAYPIERALWKQRLI